nr:probable serine/threonine-protein phosphatase 2A regulatory subunit B'' subunit TON2 isoform X2 [Tanacetum cinerariifolium]
MRKIWKIETKRILLDIFKEKQQKSAEAGTIPSFYKKKHEDGSISHKVQRLAKFRFLKKQSDILLNVDDLDAMWVLLKEIIVLLMMPLVSLTQARIDMSELDEDSDGFLQHHELREYADGTLTDIFIVRGKN